MISLKRGRKHRKKNRSRFQPLKKHFGEAFHLVERRNFRRVYVFGIQLLSIDRFCLMEEEKEEGFGKIK
jgi:hypothetical protein